MKIFLSHSSSDKDIVSNVYSELGPGICHYDVATFDPCGFLPDQIYSALSESTHFVLFASERALASEWVSGELKVAFINWMRSRMATAMVFLLRGGQRSAVPDWLQNYVVTEHPSPAHIACRILSEYDNWQTKEAPSAPFYRADELKAIEKALTVEAAKMPACLLISGPDGMGRKELINQLFSRQFRTIPSRKMLIYTESFESDVDLFKSIKGLVGLTTARDLAASMEDYGKKPLNQRICELADLIISICGSGQVLVVEAADSILNDSGELNAWVQQLIEAMPSGTYPLINIVTGRKPNFIKSSVSKKTVTCHLEPMPEDESSLLFAWWISNLGVVLPSYTAEVVLEQVSGNPALIASAARLLKSLPDTSDMRLIRKYVFSDLERSASKLVRSIADDNISRLILTFVADCGHIAASDIFETLSQVMQCKREDIRDAYILLQSYGLLQTDATSVKVPNFLSRTARAFGKTPPTDSDLRRCWITLTESVERISFDTETNIALLNEACILKLKEGTNFIPGIESLILPSQCLRTAKRLYDSNEYDKAYQLCVRAYQSRLALTDDGAIEALRYRGMSAARLNKQDLMEETLALFSEYGGSKRAKRISEFVRGFNSRLAGQFDDALVHMEHALALRGDDDIHILRELAYLYLATSHPDKAKTFITKAKARAKNNSYITELQVLVELAFGKGYVIHNAISIQGLIDELENMGASIGGVSAFRSKVRYLFTRGDVSEARAIFNSSAKWEQGVSSVGSRLLEAQILMAERKFQDAFNILVGLRKRVLSSAESQRRSTLPLIVELLIQAASGISVSSGVSEFAQNRKYMPKKVEMKTKEELKEQAAFSRYQLSTNERTVLEQ